MWLHLIILIVPLAVLLYGVPTLYQPTFKPAPESEPVTVSKAPEPTRAEQLLKEARCKRLFDPKTQDEELLGISHEDEIFDCGPQDRPRTTKEIYQSALLLAKFKKMKEAKERKKPRYESASSGDHMPTFNEADRRYRQRHGRD